MTLLASTVLLAPLAARAQVVYGPYISGAAGGSYEQQEKTNLAGGGSGQASLKSGWAGNGAVGYGFGNGFRVEVEGDYLDNQYRSVKGSNPDSVGGRENKYGAFVNGLYDFDVGSSFVYPYLGAGVGYQYSHVEPFHVGYGIDNYSASGAKGDIAGQAIAGLAFPVSGVPGLSFTVEYRFQDLIGNRRYATSYDDAPVASTRMGDVQNHSLLLGLRYAFGAAPTATAAAATTAVSAPAPAPAATPAPAPARTYLVFFDWDRSDLSDKTKTVIADAAQASNQTQTTQIEVDGYTDLSGTKVYNQALSVRRAQAVAAELVRLGVPSTEIDIQGFGETNPLVPTADGVREPQNRRVEIILK
jgi:outer membrane protein OmpA-like peptidoglycan-associated protein/outer membrane protein W